MARGADTRADVQADAKLSRVSSTWSPGACFRCAGSIASSEKPVDVCQGQPDWITSLLKLLARDGRRQSWPQVRASARQGSRLVRDLVRARNGRWGSRRRGDSTDPRFRRAMRELAPGIGPRPLIVRSRSACLPRREPRVRRNGAVGRRLGRVVHRCWRRRDGRGAPLFLSRATALREASPRPSGNRGLRLLPLAQKIRKRGVRSGPLQPTLGGSGASLRRPRLLDRPDCRGRGAPALHPRRGGPGHRDPPPTPRALGETHPSHCPPS